MLQNNFNHVLWQLAITLYHEFGHGSAQLLAIFPQTVRQSPCAENSLPGLRLTFYILICLATNSLSAKYSHIMLVSQAWLQEQTSWTGLFTYREGGTDTGSCYESDAGSVALWVVCAIYLVRGGKH